MLLLIPFNEVQHGVSSACLIITKALQISWSKPVLTIWPQSTFLFEYVGLTTRSHSNRLLKMQRGEREGLGRTWLQM